MILFFSGDSGGDCNAEGYLKGCAIMLTYYKMTNNKPDKRLAKILKDRKPKKKKGKK
jgi:hypothetical protein